MPDAVVGVGVALLQRVVSVAAADGGVAVQNGVGGVADVAWVVDLKGKLLYSGGGGRNGKSPLATDPCTTMHGFDHFCISFLSR